MESPLLIKSAAFADRILDMSDFLLEGEASSSSTRQRVRYSVEVCVKQVTRSGTSIAANVAEGKYAQSNEDLISKFYISLKEASETRMWLNRLLNRKAIDAKMHKSMDADLEELISMLIASINTLKKKREESKVKR